MHEFTSIHGQVADAFIRGDRLGDDQGQPHDAKRIAQSDEDRGQRARQKDVEENLPGLQSIDVAHLDIIAVNVPDAVIRIDVNRKQNAYRDEKYSRRFTDPDPDDDERNEGQMGDVPDHLDRRIEQPVRRFKDSVGNAEQEAETPADQQADQRPLQADAYVMRQLPRG